MRGTLLLLLPSNLWLNEIRRSMSRQLDDEDTAQLTISNLPCGYQRDEGERGAAAYWRNFLDINFR